MKPVINAICIFLLSFMLVGGAPAQEDNGANMGRGYLVDVKDGHGADFEAGAEAYIKCYADNGGNKGWGVYSAETGKLGRYAFVTDGHKWGAFDESDKADEACEEIFEKQFLPHVDRATSQFTARMDDLSRFSEGDYSVFQVIHFKVGNAHRFIGAISRITEAVREAEWGNFVWYNVVAGGRHGSDFYVAIPGKNFAAFDNDDAPLWQMVASVHGEDAAENIRAELDATIKHQWSDIWRLREALSYQPESED